MSMTEYHFRYDELLPDLQNFHAVLGFPDHSLPAPFDSYFQEALDFASELDDMMAACTWVDSFHMEPAKGIIRAGGQSFYIGKTLCKELRHSEKLIFFVCTAGKIISAKAAELLNGADPARGYIFDQAGIFLTEAAGNRMQLLIQEALSPGERMTNRYSPGYCHWDVADQRQLFSLFPPAPCGVTLTSSLLMNPVKSISGVIGIGKSVSYRDYPCALCLSTNCIYRKTNP